MPKPQFSLPSLSRDVASSSPGEQPRRLPTNSNSNTASALYSMSKRLSLFTKKRSLDDEPASAPAGQPIAVDHSPRVVPDISAPDPGYDQTVRIKRTRLNSGLKYKDVSSSIPLPVSASSAVKPQHKPSASVPVISGKEDVPPIALRKSLDYPSVGTPDVTEAKKKKRPLSIASCNQDDQQHPRSRQRIGATPAPDGLTHEPRQRTSSTLTVKQSLRDKASTETLRGPSFEDSCPTTQAHRPAPPPPVTSSRLPLLSRTLTRAAPAQTILTRSDLYLDRENLSTETINKYQPKGAPPLAAHVFPVQASSTSGVAFPAQSVQSCASPFPLVSAVDHCSVYPEASLNFNKKHVELWDPDPEAHYVFPAQLRLAYPPATYDAYTPPQMSRLEICCRLLSASTSSPIPGDDAAYEVFYIGYSIGTGSAREKERDALLTLDPSHGIHIEKRWRRCRPLTPSAATADMKAKVTKTGSIRLGKGVRGTAGVIVEDADADQDPEAADVTSPPSEGGDDLEAEEAAGRSWFMKFFVPISMGLFIGRADAVFRIHVRAWLIEEDTSAAQWSEVEIGVSAVKEMSVSCLRWKEMATVPATDTNSSSGEKGSLVI